MKVRLTAFNGLLKSEVMDWPECPSDRDFRVNAMSLRNSIFAAFGSPLAPEMCEVKRPMEHRSFVQLRFRNNGHGEQDEESGMYIHEMELIDVHPDYWYREGQDFDLKEKV